MENWTAFNGLRLAVSFYELMSVVSLGVSVNALKHSPDPTHPLDPAGINAEASSVQCILQGKPLVPAFSKDGDFVIGGVFSIHFKLHSVIYNYTTKPKSPRCTGRLVRPTGENKINNGNALILYFVKYVFLFVNY